MSTLPTPEDVAAFQAAVGDVVPLKTERRVLHEPPKPRPRPRQRELDESQAVAESLHGPLEIDDLLAIGEAEAYLRPGLSRNVLRDLRRGRWAIQDHIDLHGMNRYQAHEEVSLFLSASAASGKRCLRIVHGRGYGSPGRQGVLRLLVKSWLARSRHILAFCHAAACDGGEGALWVLLQAVRPRPPRR